MSFEFRPAVRDRVGLLIGLAGASGSGKTYTALELARGMAGDKGTIAVIDTEAGRAKHYADQFRFLHGDMTPPFTPERYIEAIAAAEAAGADVIVIDSMSHEWAGEGGCQDIHTEIVERMATDRQTGQINPARMEALSAPAWREPKTRHKRMISKLLQSRAHLIFCLRAEEKLRFRTVEEEKNGRTFKKTVIEPAGWMPICEKNFMFEMTLSFTFAADSPGMPRFDLPHKLQEQHRAWFPEGVVIGSTAGAALREWAHGGKAPEKRRTFASVLDDVRAQFSAAQTVAAVEAVLAGPDAQLLVTKGTEAVQTSLQEAYKEALARTPASSP
jgi:ABC-type dipeptide/oligopeptide/nickel transport system ATPase subunit